MVWGVESEAHNDIIPGWVFVVVGFLAYWGRELLLGYALHVAGAFLPVLLSYPGTSGQSIKVLIC